MKSVRLEDGLKARLAEAARISGESESSIIRQAIERCCDEILGARLSSRLADVTGIVHSQGGRADSTGKTFRNALLERKREGR